MDGQVVIGTKLDTKSFEKQIKEVEYQLEQLDYELSHAKELKLDSRTIKEYEAKAEKLTNQLVSLRKKQEDLNTTNLSGISSQLNNIGNSVSKVIKKVTRWGLAIFGIRSAYMFVRQAMSTLSQYNEQLGTDVEYIRFALATTLQPVIERIIQLVYTLLQYIGYIAKAWFGVNIFANASAKAFNKNNKAIAGSTSNAKKLNKELQKTLAGFDEMNVLQENKDTDTGGGGSAGGGEGFKAPSIDLSELKEFDSSLVGAWLDKLRDFLLKGFDGIVKNIKKVMKDLGFSKDLIDAFSFFMEGVKKKFKGFLDFIIGIIKTIVGLFTGNTELFKEGIKQAIDGIITFLTGALQVWVARITMGATILAEVLSGLLKFIKNNIINPIFNGFKSLWDNITNSARNSVNNIRNFFNSIPSFFSGIVNRITGFFRNIGTSAGNVIAGAFKSVVNSVLRTIENILNSPIRAINSLISTVNKVSPTKISKLSTFRLPRLAKGGIVNNPGPGVMMGSYVAGERGPEAVIPLDEKTMNMLGQSIANNMVINATVVNSMNGRVISREIQRVQNQSNFAMNR